MGHKLVKIHFVRLQCFLSVVEDPRGPSTITNANLIDFRLEKYALLP